MIEVEYAHICEDAYPDQHGRPCIIGIFDSIIAMTFPFLRPAFVIAFQLRGAPHEKADVTLLIETPSGEVLTSTTCAALMMAANGGTFMKNTMEDAEFPEAGVYSVKVMIGPRTLATKPLHLRRGRLVAAPPPATKH